AGRSHDNAVDFWRRSRRLLLLGRGKIHLEIVRELRSGDNEDHQQHERQIEQRRDIQLVERTVMAFGNLFQWLLNWRPSVCVLSTSNRTISVLGKPLGGALLRLLTCATAALTELSQRSSPEPESQRDPVTRPLESIENSTSAL